MQGNGVATAQVPELGHLVRLRGGMWVVTGVKPDGVSDVVSRNHRVRATSVDDDSHGQTVEVIWETEPGTEVIERLELPDPSEGLFDRPATLDAFLSAASWGAITSADARLLQAPFRAGIRLEDYQLVPLMRALQMPRANLLIADDVGLGKTIEAGLVLHEFVLRHRVRNALVVCPSSLQEKWRVEMRDRFGFDFHIVDTQQVRAIRRSRGPHVNPLKSHPYLIVSQDWIKRPEQEPMLDAVLNPDTNTYPRVFDLLILDEAHHAAPSGPSDKYATDSQRTRVIAKLVPHFEHRLFLTATPHNGKPESFQALLALIDGQRFQRGVRPAPAQVEQVMVRRLKSHIAAVRPDSPFAERNVEGLTLTYSDSEHRCYAQLLQYAAARRKAARDSQERLAADFSTLLLKKRFLSSPRAFAHTLDAHIDTVTEVAGKAHRSPVALQQTFERANDDHDDDHDVDQAEGDALVAAHGAGTTLSTEERDLLNSMRRWAVEHRNQQSSKSRSLLQWLQQVCRTDDGGWTKERVVLFTEYRDTQMWLRDLLIAAGFGGDNGERLELIDGSVDVDERERINADFNYDPAVTPVRILLCTDAASEGIDLHLQCHRAVHIDIPFSPSKMEQRNGRVDRHGQPSPTVHVFHFTADRDDGGPAADTFFQDLIVRKVNEIRNDLGDVNALLDEDRARLTTAQLDEQQRRLLTGQQNDVDDRARTISPQAELHRAAKELQTGIEDARAALHRTVQDLSLEPDDIAHVVNTALELDHQPPLQPTDTDGIWDVPVGLNRDWQDTLHGLWDPRADRQRAVTFNADLARPAPGPVYLHLAHPLVARATGLLRAQVWSKTTAKNLSRVTARLYNDHELPDDHPARGAVAVIAHARVVITGGDGARLHEGVVKVGGRLAERFARFDTLTKTDQVWDARQPDQVDNTSPLVEVWPRISESLLKGVHERGEEVARQMDDQLQRRRERDIAQFHAIVDETKAAIEHRLTYAKERETELQLTFEFDEDGRAQFERELKLLQHRLDNLDDEVAHDIDAINVRYAARDPRVFPISVTFLLPASRYGNEVAR